MWPHLLPPDQGPGAVQEGGQRSGQPGGLPTWPPLHLLLLPQVPQEECHLASRPDCRTVTRLVPREVGRVIFPAIGHLLLLPRSVSGCRGRGRRRSAPSSGSGAGGAGSPGTEGHLVHPRPPLSGGRVAPRSPFPGLPGARGISRSDDSDEDGSIDREERRGERRVQNTRGGGDAQGVATQGSNNVFMSS